MLYVSLALLCLTSKMPHKLCVYRISAIQLKLNYSVTKTEKKLITLYVKL